MSFDSTITEYEMDASTQKFIQGLRSDTGDLEPDLAVDGLTDGLFSRLFGLFRSERR